MKTMIRINLIRNNPVSIEDINIAEEIYGPSINMMKGKTTRMKYHQIIDDKFDLPEELYAVTKKITSMIDTMAVNRCLFLITISLDLYYRSANYIRNKTIINYIQVLEEIFRIYNDGKYFIEKICFHNKFIPTLQRMKQNNKVIFLNNNFKISPTNPQQHLPQAERNI